MFCLCEALRGWGVLLKKEPAQLCVAGNWGESCSLQKFVRCEAGALATQVLIIIKKS